MYGCVAQDSSDPGMNCIKCCMHITREIIKVNHRVFLLKRENALSDLIKSMGLDKIKLKKKVVVNNTLKLLVYKPHSCSDCNELKIREGRKCVTRQGQEALF